MSRGGGKLELTWSNKGMRLLAHGTDTYEWVDPSDWRVSEVRLLGHVETVGEEASGNLLIQGDALHALTALATLPDLAERYRGKVKLCYIDPPFNTGQTFAHYDDAVEHSVWLTMLRDRLVQIHKLLSPDGSVWVHLDDSEAHRARCVLDEVFGAENFVATVVWQKRYSRSNDAVFSVSHDTLLVYARSSGWSVRNRLNRGDDPQYSNPDDDPKGPWRGIPWDAPEERTGLDYPIITPTGAVKVPPRGRHWSGTESNWSKVVAEGRDYYGTKGAGMPNVKKYLSEMPGLVPHTVWLHTEVGSNDTAKKEIQALFPGTLAFSTPKPERLLERVVHLATDPGDIVLDCFAGSGTTAAVAHKMGRRWVTVELSAATVKEFVQPRMQRIVEGEDPGGVTSSVSESPVGPLPAGISAEDAKAALRVLQAMTSAAEASEQDKSGTSQGDADPPDAIELPNKIREALLKRVRAAGRTKKTTEVRWKGGGGFDVMEVGPSMFEEEDGTVFLAEWATGGALAGAVCAQLGYTPEADGPFAGRKGRSRLAVIDGMLTAGVAEHLAGLLDDKETMMIVAQALEPGVEDRVRELRRGSRARKVPRDLARVGLLPSRQVRLNPTPHSEES